MHRTWLYIFVPWLGIAATALWGYTKKACFPWNDEGAHGDLFCPGDRHVVQTISEMVARTGHIEYKRPIKSTIVARSVLPAASALQAFRQKLEADGKAFLDVSGHMAVEGDERVHCEYCINVCAFKPRSSS